MEPNEQDADFEPVPGAEDLPDDVKDGDINAPAKPEVTEDNPAVTEVIP